MSVRIAGALALGLLAILFAAGCGGGGTLGAESLSQQSEAMQSLAAEGALLAQDAVAGKSTSVYVRVHSSELSKAASGVEAALEGASAQPALEPKRRELVAIAGHVRSALKRLGHASEDATTRDRR